ncbi:Sec-independent protein translocase protein TatB [Arvimicrobium flavum]|uniref:Sec-independent protein translocase protein TatB n=1 Tax=Arvimicrobium flavum TaxID=3393320 RepID=UPI00237AC250|nr:Sec-independent protein translocase protein TatB [Mesorhizobium shangrilense]
MFDIGWTEMLVIAVVMIVVVGPKDLPKMLRTFGRTTSKLRTMAGDFQKQFNEAMKEAELDDVKKSVDSLRSLNPANEIKKSLNPFEKAAADVRAGLESLKTPPKPAEPASVEAVSDQPVAAEPLKSGATAMPVAGPTTMPEPPVITPTAEATKPAGAKASSAAAAAKPVAPAASTAKPARKAAAKVEAKTAAAKAPKKTTDKPAVRASAKSPAKAKKTVGSAT